MRNHCTFYADDGHACFVFHSWDELQRGLTYFGRLINILERLGMKVNITKSAAIIQWRGPDRAQANKAFVKQSQHGTTLRIPKEHHTQYEIPLREHQDYLGISVGYKQMLRGTMQKIAEEIESMYTSTPSDETMVLQLHDSHGSEAVLVGNVCPSHCTLWFGLNWC